MGMHQLQQSELYSKQICLLANEVQLIPLLYLLNAVDGVIYGQALTDYIAVILSTIIWKQYQNSITKENDSVK